MESQSTMQVVCYQGYQTSGRVFELIENGVKTDITADTAKFIIQRYDLRPSHFEGDPMKLLYCFWDDPRTRVTAVK